MKCPVCRSTDVDRIEDGYKCNNCGFSETPIGWDDYRSQRRHEKQLREQGELEDAIKKAKRE